MTELNEVSLETALVQLRRRLDEFALKIALKPTKILLRDIDIQRIGGGDIKRGRAIVMEMVRRAEAKTMAAMVRRTKGR